MNLTEAITEATNDLGITDPHEAAWYIIESNTAEWLCTELRAEAEQIIAAKIRLRYHEARTRRVTGGGTAAAVWKDEHGSDGKFVPDVGWVAHDDLTPDHCLALEADYRRQAEAMGGMADYYAGLAEQMRLAGVERVGDLTGVVEVAA